MQCVQQAVFPESRKAGKTNGGRKILPAGGEAGQSVWEQMRSSVFGPPITNFGYLSQLTVAKKLLFECNADENRLTQARNDLRKKVKNR
jgi:hypothetical protein